MADIIKSLRPSSAPHKIPQTLRGLSGLSHKLMTGIRIALTARPMAYTRCRRYSRRSEVRTTTVPTILQMRAAFLWRASSKIPYSRMGNSGITMAMENIISV